MKWLALPLLLAGCAGTSEEASLGTIVTRDHAVAIFQRPEGPRYSVKDRAGTELARNLSREELIAAYPVLAARLETATAEQRGPSADIIPPAPRSSP